MRKNPIKAIFGRFPRFYCFKGVTYIVKSDFGEQGRESDIRSRFERIIRTDAAHLQEEVSYDTMSPKEIVLTADERRKNGSQ